MLTPKEKLKKKFSQEYKKYYLVKTFKEEGFQRKICKNCGNAFWTLQKERTNCPNPPCETYGFIGEKLTKKRSYVDTWKDIEKFFVKNMHASISSYPVVCRWFPGLYFTVASIVAFQRSVAGKTVFEFPANPLIIPQQCLRFNDIPNVGVTGRHGTNFVMIGQHSLYDEKNGYWKDECIDLDFRLLTKVFGIAKEEINFVEDVWVGPNAFGYSLEYYVRGLELGNAVFTEFVGTPENYRQMDYKVIDMGAGLERFAWLSQSTPTAYDATFGKTIAALKKKIDYDKKLFQEYAKIAGGLNLDEIADIREAKKIVADKLDIDVEELVRITRPVEAVYAIADHTKTLLYAISDGALPSNVGGGYNLRIVLRRALGFIDEFDFDIDLYNVCKMHARELKYFKKFSLDSLQDILETEKKRFYETKSKNRKLIETLIEKERIDGEKLVVLYESHGITPELIEEIAKEKGIEIELPASIYVKMTEKHMAEKQEQKEEIDVSGIEKTALLFYTKPKDIKFTAKVLKIISSNVVLERTLFYPEGGGQAADQGFINGCRVYDTQKIGGVVLHKLEKITFKEGSNVIGEIDWPLREQHMKHHTAIHIINGSAREVLGNHVWQSGSAKTKEKAHLDITHYKGISNEEVDKIESLANNIVKKKLPVKKQVIPRAEAEKKYGMRIYQGGVVPEKNLRIIEISGGGFHDVEACGGTHCSNTKEVGKILVTSTERIQDGVVRITIVAGRRAEEYLEEKKALLKEIEEILGVKGVETINAAQKLFDEWKNQRKKEKRFLEKMAENITDYLESRFVKNILIEKIDIGDDPKKLQNISRLISKEDKIIILFGLTDEKINVFASVGKNTKINAGKIVKEICQKLGGKGGGSSLVAQGFGINKEKLDVVIEELKRELHG